MLLHTINVRFNGRIT